MHAPVIALGTLIVGIVGFWWLGQRLEKRIQLSKQQTEWWFYDDETDASAPYSSQLLLKLTLESSKNKSTIVVFTADNLLVLRLENGDLKYSRFKR